MIKEFVIDLFCGAGGTSEGVHLANCDSQVVFCVNHDAKAIESHRLNHPYAKHLVEDIRNPEVIFFLKLRYRALRKLYPNCIITGWGSLECINFSKAKGGLPRDADSRTLANDLVDMNGYFIYNEKKKKYKKTTKENYLKFEGKKAILECDSYINKETPFDYFMIENVVEFMSWGPLDENGKPISRKKGIDYLKWVDTVKSYGYKFDWKELNSANFGAYTSRSRYFAQFAKDNLPISWPEPTHTKNPKEEITLFEKPLKKWKAVKEVLNLENEGVSIFNRKKPLVENTLKRIYAGLVKFVANGDDSFIKKYYSGRPKGKVISVNGPAGTVTTFGGQGLVKCDFIQRYYSGNDQNRNHSLDEPAGVVRTNNCMAYVKADFLLKYNSINGKTGNHVPPSIDEPCPVVSTQGRLGIVNASFLQSYYGNGMPHSTEEPCPTIPTKDRFGKVNYLMMNYGNGNTRSIEVPGATVLNNDKHNLVSAKHYLYNPQYSNNGNSIENPCPVIIARQDKKPLGLISCEVGDGFVIPVYEDECETMVKIKMFMAYHGIIDIKMRMLEVEELLQIQGFPKDYKLVGNQTDQKKFIGNSVEVTTAKKLFEAHHESLVEHFENKIAA